MREEFKKVWRVKAIVVPIVISDPQTWGVAPADPTSEIPVQKRNNKGTVQDRQASVHLVDHPRFKDRGRYSGNFKK